MDDALDYLARFFDRFLKGIPNGIDESWEPESDPYLVSGFSARDWTGKQANAAYVRDAFGLEVTRNHGRSPAATSESPLLYASKISPRS